MRDGVWREWTRPIHDGIARSAEHDRFSGAVLVSIAGKLQLAAGYGAADRERNLPNTPGTRFRIGSLNKMFTATAILQLVQDGALALADRIVDLIPDYANADFARRATVHHLLTHTSGLGDFWGDRFAAHRTELQHPADYVALFADTPAQDAPGARWTYSSLGYIILGRIVEVVSNKDYYDFVRARIFEPAGMADTDSLPEKDAGPGLAAGYTHTADGWRPDIATLPYRGTPAGGGYSTVTDLDRFAGAVLAHRLLDTFHTDCLVAAKTKAMVGTSYAYGFMVADRHGAVAIGHTGAAPGMAASFWACPEQGWQVVVLSNRDGRAASKIADALCDKLSIGT